MEGPLPQRRTRLCRPIEDLRRKADAQVFETEVRRRKALGELAALGARTTLDELARDWYEVYAAPNLAENTLAKYRLMLKNYVLPKLGGLKIAEITPEVVARFRANLEREGVGRDSVRTSLVVTQAIFRHAVEWGRATTNPVMAVRKPSAGQKVRGAGPRSIDLTPPLKQDLAAWRLRCGRPADSQLVFPRHGGEAWRRHDWNNWRPRMWIKAVGRAGLRYAPPYDLRHAFASLQIRAGASIPELAEQLGHSAQMTLSTYTHVIRELRGSEPLTMEQQIRRARDPGTPSEADYGSLSGSGLSSEPHADSRVSSVCPEAQEAER